jgi:Carbohydrate binding domain
MRFKSPCRFARTTFGVLPVVAGLFLSLHGAQAENAVQNPGFESDKEGWKLFVAPGSEGSEAVFDVATDNPHAGSSAAKLSAVSAIRYGIYPMDMVSVEPGEHYRVTAWVRFGDDAELKSEAPAAYLRATLFESPKVDISDPRGHMHIGLSGAMARNDEVDKLKVTELPKGWTKIEGVIEIPPSVTLMGLTLFDQGVSGSIYWDDVAIEKVDASTPLAPSVSKK